MKTRTKSKELSNIKDELKDYREDFSNSLKGSGLTDTSERFTDFVHSLHEFLSVQHAPEEENTSWIDEKLDHMDSRLKKLSSNSDLILHSIESLESVVKEANAPPPIEPIHHEHHHIYHHPAPSNPAPQPRVNLTLTGTQFRPTEKPKKKLSLLDKISLFFKNLFKK